MVIPCIFRAVKNSRSDAAMRYAEEHTPLVIVAGKEYGTGSSRDWAAKGTNLLGVKQSLPKALSVFTVLIWLEWGFAVTVCRWSNTTIFKSDR